jgi:protocatechuate 3,4-dioxygenase beta subunit
MNRSKYLVTVLVLILISISTLPSLYAQSTTVPIPNAGIEVTGSEGKGTGVTGADGTFQITEALAQGTYSVSIGAKGYLTKAMDNIAIQASQVTDLGDIYLNASAVIRGTVEDPNGNPVGPAVISLEKGASVASTVLADDHGSFVFDTDIRTGTYTLVASTALNMQVYKEGYSPGTISVTATEGMVTDGVTVKLGVSGIISGTVSDKQGNAIKNMMVIAYLPGQGIANFGSFAYTDANGAYRMANNLATGTYNVTVFSTAGYVWSYSNATQVQVQAGQETKDVNFQLAKSAKISGKVVYSDGSPAPNATVTAFSQDYKYFSTNRSDVSGNFMLESNLGTGDYMLMATAGHVFSLPVEAGHIDAGQEVSGITITLSGVGVSQAIIAGTITDDNGKALVDAEVETVSGVSSPSSASADESGKYTLTVYLPEGATSADVQVMGLCKGYNSVTDTVHVEAGNKYTQNFQLSTMAWGTLKGRVVSMVSKSPTTLSIALSASSVQIGTTVTISGSLNPARTGSVSIYTSFGGSAFSKVAEVNLSNGQYSYSITPIQMGTYLIKADWPGDNDYAASTSSQAALTVTKITPTVSLSLSSTSVSVGDSITATGTITPFSGTTEVDLAITGSSGTNQASVTSTDGTFTYTFTESSEGTYTIQASIPDSANYNAAQSSQVTVSVQKKCVIATATYGSELSPEVSFLRGFRNNFILKTYSGSKFYIAFDAFYYSWSTPVAVFISQHEGIKMAMKFVLYPLIGALELTANLIFPWSNTAPEMAAVTAGFIASSLIGLIYFFPLALLIRYVLTKFRNIRPVPKRFLKCNALFVLLMLPVMAIGILANSSMLTTISTSLYVLAIVALAGSTGLYAVERKLFLK